MGIAFEDVSLQEPSACCSHWVLLLALELRLPVSSLITGKPVWSSLCCMVKNKIFWGEIATGGNDSPALGNAILCGTMLVDLQFLIPFAQQENLHDNSLPTLRCKYLAFLEIAEGRALCWDLVAAVCDWQKLI